MKTKTNSLRAVISWNVKEHGFTETISSCYGWGKLKTLRTVSSAGRDVQIYGSPLITFNGGLIQLVYNNK